MNKIRLESILGISTLDVELDTNPEKGVNIYYKDHPEDDIHFGGYSKSAVKQFVRELAELLGLTFEKDLTKEEPYILPDKLVEKLKYELSKNQPDSDQFIWEACTQDSDTVIGNWVQETDNAIEQLWNIFQGHPFEAEKFYVLRDSDDDYLRSYTIASDGTAEGDLTMYPSNAVKFSAKEDAEAVQRLLKDYRFNIGRY